MEDNAKNDVREVFPILWHHASSLAHTTVCVARKQLLTISDRQSGKTGEDILDDIIAQDFGEYHTIKKTVSLITSIVHGESKAC